MHHLDPKEESVMESSTMIRDGDGGSPDAGVPTSESQAGYPTQASLAAEPSPTKGAKRGNFWGKTKPIGALELVA